MREDRPIVRMPRSSPKRGPNARPARISRMNTASTPPTPVPGDPDRGTDRGQGAQQREAVRGAHRAVQQREHQQRRHRNQRDRDERRSRLRCAGSAAARRGHAKAARATRFIASRADHRQPRPVDRRPPMPNRPVPRRAVIARGTQGPTDRNARSLDSASRGGGYRVAEPPAGDRQEPCAIASAKARSCVAITTAVPPSARSARVRARRSRARASSPRVGSSP